MAAGLRAGGEGSSDPGPGGEEPSDPGPEAGGEGPRGEEPEPGGVGPSDPGPGREEPGGEGPSDPGPEPGRGGPSDPGPGREEPGGEGPSDPGPEPGGEGPSDPGPEPGGEGPSDPGPEPGGEGPSDPGPEPGGEGPSDPGPEPGGEGPSDPGPEPGGEGPSDPGPGGEGPEPGFSYPGERPGPGGAPGAACRQGDGQPVEESGSGQQMIGSQRRGEVATPPPAVCPGSDLGPGCVSRLAAGGEAELAVLFPGRVSPESCCRLVCELLKHILYQRQQLPLPYDQLAFFSSRERRPADDSMLSRSRRNEQNNCKKSQRMLSELDEVFQNLETLFMLTLVPCVLILLGGSVVNPKEMYEINMERIAFGSTEESLKTASCIRKLFHTLFVKDLFNELKSIPLMNTVLLVQGQRDSGLRWFRPKLNYRVPNRTRKLVIRLACDTMGFTSAEEQTASYNCDDYIWFQAPITIKGFH